jgi:hypothetical protein
VTFSHVATRHSNTRGRDKQTDYFQLYRQRTHYHGWLVTLVNTLETWFNLPIGHTIQVPLRQVISAERGGRSLEISYIWRKKKADPMFLTKLVGTAEDVEDDVLDAWIATLLHMAYEGPFHFPVKYRREIANKLLDMGVKRGRRLKVIINPHGGNVCLSHFFTLLLLIPFQKKGVAVFNKTVEPILRAAQCTLDIIRMFLGRLLSHNLTRTRYHTRGARVRNRSEYIARLRCDGYSLRGRTDTRSSERICAP